MTLTEGVKEDGGKPRWDLMPSQATEEIAEVFTFGAEKYAAHNFRKGLAFSRLFAACQRHLWAWVRGEENDPETGLSHLSRAVCNLLMIRDLQIHRGDQDDDRWKPKERCSSYAASDGARCDLEEGHLGGHEFDGAPF